MTVGSKGDRPRVFVSHSSANLESAQEVCEALRAGGSNPWLDRADIPVMFVVWAVATMALIG